MYIIGVYTGRGMQAGYKIMNCTLSDIFKIYLSQHCMDISENTNTTAVKLFQDNVHTSHTVPLYILLTLIKWSR